MVTWSTRASRRPARRGAGARRARSGRADFNCHATHTQGCGESWADWRRAQSAGYAACLAAVSAGGGGLASGGSDRASGFMVSEAVER